MRLAICCGLIFPVYSSWTEPSKDVEPNPACDPSTVRPSVRTPKDATELHPGHIKYSMAIGDSITAAALAGGGPVEYRQESWSGGRGSPHQSTMPFLMNQYASANRTLVGPAKGSFQWDQLGPCCGKAPWWSGIEADNDQLNAALSGALSSDWKLMVDHLTSLVSGGKFGIDGLGGWHPWEKAEQMDFRKSWKVLTVFFGMNDVLTTVDACSDDAENRKNITVSFRKNMIDLFDHLVANDAGVFGNLYVNVASLFRVSYMGKQNMKHGWCHVSGGSFLQSEFPCMRGGGDLEKKGRLLDDVTHQMNEIVEELAATYDMKRADFGVNLVQTLANTQITHEDLRSDLDCFHPTSKAQRIMGTALWNGMLTPSKPTEIDDVPRMPTCADADTKLVTYRAKLPKGMPRATVII